ncbi:DoxX family protein [Mycetocola tolaasinivorans]|uniref:DoxX family protein n=1 Tax=Mycetocola tolaasinivorans TaxID=76635 RepID=A0A3L7AD77_9MICO|nr:DoxX family protein [Mycetocola tolaasinivorans]RLP77760.1 DoxX family protein [Mycetocola tolaasinivorans]
MFIALIILNALLALAFIGSGGMKVVTPIPRLSERGMTFVDRFPTAFTRFIGLAEVIGGIGLILPVVTGVAPVLTPIAALGLAVIMIGAIVIHVRHREPVIPVVVLTLLSLASAVLGFLYIAS